ncbi:cofilin-1-B-like isoform X2 [Syngnathus typhle]|uniref:cofilin-1-B-like isoform X2 n=1 Tax=Syngnathus typhle TaxID=161592 RepID=UPI002A6B05E8|nr:cofilin-1-B-like isoform X2 [Syngnathus typhle]
MTSGVNVAKEVADLYDDIKFKKTLKVAFFRISDDKKSIIVDTENQVKWNQEDPYSTFVKMLPEDDCRYIVFDVSYVTNDSGDKTQLVFISCLQPRLPTRVLVLLAGPPSPLPSHARWFMPAPKATSRKSWNCRTSGV